MLSLRSKIAQQVLGYLVLHEENEMYLNEMCRRFGADRGNLVRKLKELEKEGILRSQWKGNQLYYRLNHAFPLLKEYKRIVLKTVGLEHSLREVLHRVPGVKEALLFGSYARDRMDANSDVDLLVVGDHNTIALQREIAQVEKGMDREINVISMSPAEYQKKRKSSPLLRSISKERKVSLV